MRNLFVKTSRWQLAVISLLTLSIQTSFAEVTSSVPNQEQVFVKPYLAILPSAENVKQAIFAHPMVQQTQQNALAQNRYAENVKAGGAEFMLRINGQRRSVDEATQRANWHEYGIGVERSIRLPHKATADQQVGDAMQSIAKFSIADAQHEVSRALLASWFAVIKTASQVQLQKEIVQATQTQYLNTQRRVALGDAARMEAEQMQGELNRVQASLLKLEGEATVSRQHLQINFPQVGLPSETTIVASTNARSASALPALWKVEEEINWLEIFLNESHEANLSTAQTELAQRQVQRSRAEQVPEPTVGLYMANERGGAEKLIGINISVPFNLPFGHNPRSTKAEAASYEAVGAQQRHLLQMQKLKTEFKALLSNTRSSIARSQTLQQSLLMQRQITDKVQRAYNLGESSLAEVRLAQRNFAEVAMSTDQALIEAHELLARLALDRHQLWDFD